LADLPEDVKIMLISGGIVAGSGAVAAVALYVGGARKVFYPTKSPVGRWNGLAVALALFIAFFSPFFLQGVISKLGFYRLIYDESSPIANPPDPDKPQQEPLTEEQKKLLSATSNIRSLWSAAISFPLQLALLLYIRKRQSPGPLLRLKSMGSNYVSGYLTWLIVTPTAFLIFVFANYMHQTLTGSPPTKHPLTQMGELARGIEYTLFFFHAVVYASIVEEVFFRGMLLPWLMARKPIDGDPSLTVPTTHRSLLAMLMAIALATMFHLSSAERAVQEDSLKKALSHFVPSLFFAALVPLFIVLPKWRRLRRHLRIRSEHDVRAIIACSTLFAAFHAAVWPSPVPLFALAMGLGYLYARTKSLVGPVVVHSLFNAVSAVNILLGGAI
jgi:membrane protease YdiL (CAAX protease family)